MNPDNPLARLALACVAPALAALALVAVPMAAHAQRPAPGDPYEQSAQLEYLDSDGGRFRVWYATNTGDAVAPADVAPADGVPDFAAEVAVVAEETYDIFAGELGFRPPLIDSDYLPAADTGGDARFDIYLWDFANADGSYEVDGCVSEPADWCFGYVLMENDFVGFGYPSIELAIRTLVSHEYFHAVQSAYDAGQDAKWTEGSAVWAEEKAYPEQTDYERLVRYFLEKPFRAFDRTTGSAFGDGYPYGAALWPTFLDERYGPDIVREVWEACESTNGESLDFLTATDGLLKSEYESSLEEAWLDFTQWNLFTGSRAAPGRAYARGGDWQEVALEPVVAADGGSFTVTQQTEGMSARYTPVALPALGGELRELAIEVESGAAAVGTAYLWQNGAMSDAMALEPDPENPRRATLELTWQGTPLLYLVVTGISRGAPMRTVTLSMGKPGDTPATIDDGGCRAGGGAPSPGALVLVLLGAAFIARRRRRGVDRSFAAHDWLPLATARAKRICFRSSSANGPTAVT